MVLNQCGSRDLIQSMLASEKVIAKIGTKNTAVISMRRAANGSPRSWSREALIMRRLKRIQSPKKITKRTMKNPTLR